MKNYFMKLESGQSKKNVEKKINMKK